VFLRPRHACGCVRRSVRDIGCWCEIAEGERPKEVEETGEEGEEE